METGFARAPLPSYTAITPATRAPERTTPAARTELPAGKTVPPAQELDEARRAADNGAKSETGAVVREVERKNVIDPESDSMIFIATDTQSGEVVVQLPSETRLKLRAYVKAVEEQTAQKTNRVV
ncbi:conserved hypothetical protein [Roseibium sp. TrichSKD4]|uniref:hypothetical protein n=1 Tax=Roseibium sp. TrichSKD4 TaxID=744980 RepID=UPI0001E57432|nr:hypothetical protein [Roseibium sp. TrichSKD4]EFO30772.1 conserved hypothetical protein [Roseibium sp. TrichSKD4]